MRQVASALALIHEQGIVHRDLKPANVFLLPRELSGDFAKVVDFGISKVTGAETRLTRAFTMVGTPECMSPEQATGRWTRSDGRSDQWALACVVWRMLSGARPFPGTTLKDIIRQIVTEDPSPFAAPPDGPPPGRAGAAAGAVQAPRRPLPRHRGVLAGLRAGGRHARAIRDAHPDAQPGAGLPHRAHGRGGGRGRGIVYGADLLELI